MTRELDNCKAKQRRIRMLDIFRDRRRATAQGLADELGCDVRTIYRDVAELKAYGLPIDGEAHEGYLWRGNSL